MIVLYWQKIDNVDRYLIYKSKVPDRDFVFTASITDDTIYIDNDVSVDTYYYYYIVASTNGVESVPSAVVRLIDFSGNSKSSSEVFGAYKNKFYRAFIDALCDANVYNKTKNILPFNKEQNYLFLTDDISSDQNVNVFLNNKMVLSQRYTPDKSYLYAQVNLPYGDNTFEVRDQSNQVLRSYHYTSQNLYTILDAVSQSLSDVDEDIGNIKGNQSINNVLSQVVYDNFGSFLGLRQKIEWTNETHYIFVRSILMACLESSTDKGLKDTIRALTGVDPYILENYKSSDLAIAQEANDIDIVNGDFSLPMDGTNWQFGREFENGITTYAEFNAATVKTAVDIESSPGDVSIQKQILFSDDFTSGSLVANWNNNDTVNITTSANSLNFVQPLVAGYGNSSIYCKTGFDVSLTKGISVQMIINQTSGICLYGIVKGYTKSDIGCALYFSNNGDIKLCESGVIGSSIVGTYVLGKYYQIRIDIDSSNVVKYYIRGPGNVKADLNGLTWTLLNSNGSTVILSGSYSVGIVNYSANSIVNDVYIYKPLYAFSGDSIDPFTGVSPKVVIGGNMDNTYYLRSGKTTAGLRQLMSYGGTGSLTNAEYSTDGTYLNAFDDDGLYYISGGGGSTYVGLNIYRYEGQDENRWSYLYRTWTIKRFISNVSIKYSVSVDAFITTWVDLDIFLDGVHYGTKRIVTTSGGIQTWTLPISSTISFSEIKLRILVSPRANNPHILTGYVRIYSMNITANEYVPVAYDGFELDQSIAIPSIYAGKFYSTLYSSLPSGTSVKYYITYSNESSSAIRWTGGYYGNNSVFNNATSSPVVYPTVNSWIDEITPSYVLKNARYALVIPYFVSDGGDTPILSNISLLYCQIATIINRLDLGGTPRTNGIFTEQSVKPEGTSITYKYKYSSDGISYLPAIGYSVLNNSQILPYRFLEVEADLSTNDPYFTPTLNGWFVSYSNQLSSDAGIFIDENNGAVAVPSLRLTEYGNTKTTYQTVSGLTDTPYVASFFAKSDIEEDNNVKVKIRNSTLDYDIITKTVSATSTWVRYTVPFMIFEPLPIRIELTKNTSTVGNVWFDDIRIDHANYMYNSLARLLIYNADMFVNNETVTKGVAYGYDSLLNTNITPMFDKSGIYSVEDSIGIVYRENEDFVVDRTNGYIDWYVPSANAVESLDQSYDETNRDSDNVLRNTSATTKLGQSFRVSTVGKCSKIGLYLMGVGTPVGTLSVDICEDNAGNPGTVLATSQNINAQDISTTARQWIDFVFLEADRPTLRPNETYHIVLISTYDFSVSDYVQLGIDTIKLGYSDGNFERYNGTSWIADLLIDSVFKVYLYYSGGSKQPMTNSQYTVSYSYIPKDIYENMVNLIKPAHLRIENKYYMQDGKSESAHDYGLWDIDEFEDCGWK